MINTKDLDVSKTRIDEKSSENILICYIGYVTVKDLRYEKFNNVNLLYFIINKINGYTEVSNKNKYLMLVSTDEIKDSLKNMKKYGPK